MDGGATLFRDDIEVLQKLLGNMDAVVAEAKAKLSNDLSQQKKAEELLK